MRQNMKAMKTRNILMSAAVSFVLCGATIGAEVPSFVPSKLFEGSLPGAENAHPAVKEIPTEK